VTSDFIVGYCGETDEEFEATVDLVRRLQFKNSFIFKYRPRPGTKAFERLPDDVPEEVKRERNRVLLEAQAEASLAGNAGFVATRQKVLVEGLSPREEKTSRREEDAATHVTTDPDRQADRVRQLAGRTMCDRIVVFDGPERLVGRILDVNVIAAGSWTLSGVLPQSEPAAL
jgi:tRNA-2-methylthio-N6-dimethylallyladenosine synthase